MLYAFLGTLQKKEIKEKYQRATDTTQTQQFLERLGKLNLHSLKKKKKGDYRTY